MGVRGCGAGAGIERGAGRPESSGEGWTARKRQGRTHEEEVEEEEDKAVGVVWCGTPLDACRVVKQEDARPLSSA
jgi:hypothetical protein